MLTRIAKPSGLTIRVSVHLSLSKSCLILQRSRFAHSRSPENMTEALEIARLKAIIEVYQQHHANCPTVTHENTTSLQQSLSNLVVDFHDTQGTSLSASKEQGHSLQVVLCTPENERKRKNPTNISSLERKRNKSKEKDWESARNTLIANVNDAEDVVVPSLCIRTMNTGTDTPFDRGKAYARRTFKIIESYHEKEIQARVELFLFLSCCVVLENLCILTHDQADELMATLATSQTSQYLRRMRDGAAYLNQCLVSGLVAKAWRLEDATSVIAKGKQSRSFMMLSLTQFVATSPRPYWYGKIKNPNNTCIIIESLHGRQPQVQGNACCLVSDYVLQWDPSLRYLKTYLVIKASTYTT